MTRWLLCATAITAVGGGFTRAETPPPAALANTSTVAAPAGQSVRAAAPDDAIVLLMRTAGQPDRKLKILKRSAFNDGEVLLDVQDISSGQTFTLPGRVADRLPRQSLASVTNSAPPAGQFATGLAPTSQPPTTQAAMLPAEPPAPPSFNPLNRISQAGEVQSPTANYAPPPAYATNVAPAPAQPQPQPQPVAQVPVQNPVTPVATAQPTPGTIAAPPVATVTRPANLPPVTVPTQPVAQVPVVRPPVAQAPIPTVPANPIASTTTSTDGMDWKPIESASSHVPPPSMIPSNRAPGLVPVPSASEQPAATQPGTFVPKAVSVPTTSEDRWKPILPATAPTPGTAAPAAVPQTLAPAAPAPAPAIQAPVLVPTQPMLTPVPSPMVPKAPADGTGTTVRGQMPLEKYETRTPFVTRSSERSKVGVPQEPQSGFVRLIGRPVPAPTPEPSLASIPVAPSMIDAHSFGDDALTYIVRQEMQPFEHTLTTALRPSLRMTAARDLGELRYAARREVKMVLMRGAMSDPSPVVQAECVRSLAKLGFADTEYLAFLTNAAKDSPAPLRVAAADSLRALRSRD